MSKRWMTLTSIVCLLTLALSAIVAGCTKPEPAPGGGSAPTQAAPGTAASPYRIGLPLDITGAFAGFGIPTREGALIALDQINGQGGVNGRQIELLFYDNGSDETKAVLNAKKAIDVDKAVAVTGMANIAAVMATMETVQRGETPAIGLAPIRGVNTPVKKWYFGAVPGEDQSNQKIVEYLKRKGYKTIAYQYIDTAAGQWGIEEIKKATTQAGITILSAEKHGPNDKDLTIQLTKHKAAKPDAIVVVGLAGDTAIFMKNVQQLGITTPIISDYGGAASPDFLRLAGDAANGLVFPQSRLFVPAEQLLDNDPQKPAIVKFTQLYKAKTGSVPTQFAGNAYDALYMISQGLKKIGPGVDPDKQLPELRSKLRDEIEKTRNFVGTWGIFNFSAEDHNGLTPDALVFIQVVDGKYQLVP